MTINMNFPTLACQLANRLPADFAFPIEVSFIISIKPRSIMSSTDQEKTETSEADKPEPTLYETVSTALGYPPETAAHKAGREAGEAAAKTASGVKETIDEAVKTVNETIEYAAIQAKEYYEGAREALEKSLAAKETTDEEQKK